MLRILEIEIKNPINATAGIGCSDASNSTDYTSYQSLMYTIQGYSQEKIDSDSPLPKIQEEEENEDSHQIPSSVRPKLQLNKDQYFSSQESQTIGSFKHNHLFDHGSDKDLKN